MKKVLVVFVAVCLILTGCQQKQPAKQQTGTSIAVNQPTVQERPQRPQDKEAQLKWLVSELQHRHYVSLMKGELQDVGDIAQDNANMELWKISTLWGIKNKTPQVSLVGKTVDGKLEIIEETEDEIKAEVYTQTVFYQPYQNEEHHQISVGDYYTVTFKKNGEDYVIVNCSTDSATHYNSLRNAFNKYVGEGMSGEEAVNRIYADEGLERAN